MGDILLSARPANRSADTLLVSGLTDTGYILQPGVDFGNAVWSKFYSEARGTQGARLAGATPQNRVVTLPLEVVGDDQDDLQAKLSVLWDLDGDFRRYGGSLTWRPQGGSFKQYFDVLDGGVQIDSFEHKFVAHSRLNVTMGLVCAPYLRGDSYDIFDGFDWTDNVGYIANPTFSYDTASWSTYGTNTIARATSPTKYGIGSLLCTYQNDLRLASANAIVPNKNSMVTASAWVYVPAAWDGGQITIIDDGQFYGAAFYANVNANMALRDQWQRIYFTYDICDDTIGSVFVRAASAPTAGRVIYIDGVQVEHAYPNIAPNPGIETDTAGWNAYPPATISRDSGTFHGGVASLKAAYTTSTGGGAYTQIPVEPSMNYRAGAWINANGGAAMALVVEQFDALGNWLGATGETNLGWTHASGWEYHWATFTTLPDAASIFFYVLYTGTPTTGQFYVDDVDVTKTPGGPTTFAERATAGEFTIDAANMRLVPRGGTLVPLETGYARWRHTGRGYSYGDVQVTLKITTGATVTSYEADLMLTADTAGADTHFSAQLFGGNIRLVQFIAGAQTVLATTAFALAANTAYWLRIRREGRNLYAHVYTSEPTLLGTPAASATAQLSTGASMVYAFGQTGIRLTVVDTGERYDDFRVEPFLYGGALTGPLYTKTAPDEFPLRPSPIGDAPPLADFVVDHIGGSASPIFALASWWRRPSVWNYVWNGDFEDDVDGWSVAAVAGVTGAATSNVRSTTAARNKYGGANMQVVCPATANVGTTFKINRRFYQGRDYLILVWASSAAQTTLARARLGVSGDIASSTTVTLSAIPSPYLVLWSPTADRDGAYAAFEITAATATTMNIDGVVVCEARSTTLTKAIDGTQTTCVVDRVPDDWPTPPFLASVLLSAASELISVEAIDYATRTLTITRSVERSTAAAAGSANPIIPLPELRYQYEGKGAQPPVGVIEAESCDTGNITTWAVTTVAGTRLGQCLSATGLSGAGSAWADWLIDPNLLVPDDYAGQEFAVVVWARVLISDKLTNPTAVLQLAPEPNPSATGFTPLYGGTRYAEEYGSAGKSLAGATTTGPYWRFTRLGTLRMIADRTSALRSRLGLLIRWDQATAGQCKCDYLVLVPSNSHALSPTGKTPDAGYPFFLNSVAAEAAKTVRSDLSGALAKPPGAAYPDHGLGGSLLELPPGNIDTFLKLSSHVPDWQVLGGADEQLGHTISAHWRVSPRFTLARDS